MFIPHAGPGQGEIPPSADTLADTVTIATSSPGMMRCDLSARERGDSHPKSRTPPFERGSVELVPHV